MSAEERWFALFTKRHKEYLVRDLLRDQGIEVYLPESRVASGRGALREGKPFLPQYLFARLELRCPVIAKLRWMPGLRWIIANEGQPVPVPDEAIGHIRRRLAPMGLVDPREDPGREQGVCMIRGSFEGLDPLFDERLSPDARVQVFTRWVGSCVAGEPDPGTCCHPPSDR